jgi:phosphatidylglycerophosphate synthase
MGGTMTTQSLDAAVSHARERPTAADFRAHSRGGGLFTETVNQRVASYLCVPAHRFGLTPTTLTLANLVLGVGASILVGNFGVEARGRTSAIAALAGLVMWQLAYSLDCADGQLARQTGRSSSAGARLDVLCDIAVQVSLVVAICTAGATYSPDMPSWLPSMFGSVAVFNLFISVSVESGRAAGSLLVDKSRLFARAASLVFDYGMLITAFTTMLALDPVHLDEFMRAFIVVNLAFLAVRIAAATRASRKSN